MQKSEGENVPTRHYSSDILLSVGERVRINFAHGSLRPVQAQVEQYREVVGEVIETRADGLDALVRFPDGTMWRGIAPAWHKVP